MRNILMLSVVLLLSVEFFFMVVCQGSAEIIYGWKDSDGNPCFSNVSPSTGVIDYSTTLGASSEELQTTLAGVDGSTSADGKMTPAKERQGSGFDGAAEVLRQQIHSQERSIEHMEMLLKSDPKNEYLRWRIINRKQRRNENIIRMDTLTD